MAVSLPLASVEFAPAVARHERLIG